MKELVIATRNTGKLTEIKALLTDLVDTVYSALDFSNFPETVEDGATFKENALKKAREAADFCNMPALADDSGLVVDILDGRPGVYSARFAGDTATDADNNAKLVAELQGIPQKERKAEFISVLAFVTPKGVEETFTGRVSGVIVDNPKGEGGFGYDPFFLVDDFSCTMAELGLKEKNKISHRGQAFSLFLEYLEKSALTK